MLPATKEDRRLQGYIQQLYADAASTHLFNGPDTDSINLVFVKSGNFVPAHPSYGQTFDQFCGEPIVQSGKLSLPTLTLERVMTDKELLELAAKAAGGFVYVENMGWIEQDEHGNRGSWWNPFGDDGDALRLAVKLEIDVDHILGEVATICTNLKNMDFVYEDYRDDPYAATRRAIVRAAAEIGRAM